MKDNNYKEILQNLYNEAGKYSDRKLADAVGEIRDYFAKYGNVFGVIDSSRQDQKVWNVQFYDRGGYRRNVYFDTIVQCMDYIKENENKIYSQQIWHLTNIAKRSGT